MNAKARITYRFDKEHGARVQQKPEEPQRKPEPNGVPYLQQELNFTADIGPWNSPFQDDAHALEQLIRESDNPLQGREGELGPDGAHTGGERRGAGAQTAPEHPDFPVGNEWKPEIVLLGGELDHQEPASDAAIDWTAGSAKSVPANRPAVSRDTLIRQDKAVVAQRPKQADFEKMLLSDESGAGPVIDMEEELHYHSAGRIGGSSSLLHAVEYRSPSGPSWLKVFASVAGAVVTGALFGYLVLALFAGGDGGSGSAQTANANMDAAAAVEDRAPGRTGSQAAPGDADAGAVPAEGNNAAAMTGSANTGTSGESALKVNVPSETYYMLQYGVFSSRDTMDAAAAELQSKGLAAVPLTTAEDYRVYIGLAGDKQGAAALARTVPDIEVYTKPVQVPALSHIRFGGNSQIAAEFLKQTGALIRLMDGFTVEKLAQAGSAEQSSWQELHRTWTANAEKMKEGLAREADRQALAKLEQLLNASAVALNEYAKKPSDAALWTVQASLMKAVFGQKEWYAAMESL